MSRLCLYAPAFANSLTNTSAASDCLSLQLVKCSTGAKKDKCCVWKCTSNRAEVREWFNYRVVRYRILAGVLPNWDRDDVIKWMLFCVTGPLCEEFTGHWWIPLTKGQRRGLWCFFYAGSHKLLNKRLNGRWFETTRCSCDVIVMYALGQYHICWWPGSLRCQATNRVVKQKVLRDVLSTKEYMILFDIMSVDGLAPYVTVGPYQYKVVVLPV